VGRRERPLGTAMDDIRKVLVIGAGIGGLGAGTALANRGVDVEIVEIKPEANVYGVGINQPANSLRALKALGVLDEVRDVGFEWHTTKFNDHVGNLVVSVPSQLGGDDVPHNTGLTRRDLHDILIGAAERSGARITYGTTVEDIHDNGAAEVRLSDGREERYDLVVAFDGINSAQRKRLFGDEYQPVYTGYGVWRVTVPRPAEIDYTALYQAPGAKAGHIPLSQDLMYLLLVHPEPHRARFDRSQHVDMLRERLAPFEGVIGDIRDNLKASDDVVYSPLSEVMLPAPWYRGRVLLCGDAAHACTPHITQGAAMALEDAVVLPEELARSERPLEERLHAFGERRYPRAKFVQDVSRGILNAEMQINAQNIHHAFAHMKEELPGQMAGVDAFLDQPA
jgi:2-polyprenyl-6-methoxyphenol hydroxylase-like FAD-dependent oxidoreductase